VIAVLGTGPSACAVVGQLVRHGIKPLIIDPHIGPDFTAVRFKSELRSLQPLERIRAAKVVKQSGLSKTWFGSRFPYDNYLADEFDTKNSSLGLSSNAFGGFSRVWGATVDFDLEFLKSSLPHELLPTDRDITYVSSILPSSTTSFDISATGKLRGSPQSLRLRNALSKSANFRVSDSVLAINTSGQSACVHCGICTAGCPEGSIWSADALFEDWLRQQKIRIMRGVKAVSLHQEANTITIELVELKTRARRSIQVSRVLLACGPVATANLLVSSGIRSKVKIFESGAAYSAVLDLRGPKGLEYHHGLSQFWISSLVKGQFSAQFYPPSRLNSDRIQAALKPLPLPSRLSYSFAQRLHPVISYVPQHLSGSLVVSRDGSGIKTEQVVNEALRSTTVKYLRHASKALMRNGFYLPPWLIRPLSPGTSYHTGSSLPIGTETSEFGTLQNYDRIHVVDGSVLPKIPVGSVTPIVMLFASSIARRISGLAIRDEQ
jgi:ferredoxin